MIRIWSLYNQIMGEVGILNNRIVYDASGAAVNLMGPLTTGSEGEIFTIDGSPGYCAKIFYENRLTATLFQKVMAMVANPPDAGRLGCREKHGSVVLAWPVSLLFDSPLGSRNFIGYTMPHVDTGLFHEARSYYDPKDRIREYGGAFSWRYLLTAAYNIAAVTDDIHRHGHCAADFSGRNILIAPTAAVAVIDCDSFQIRDSISGRVFPSVVGMGEYLPPELQNLNFLEERVDRYYGDLFGLAVMIFKLLMDGVHPFQAESEGISAFPGIEQKIHNGVFAFDSPDENIRPPSFAPNYQMMPPSIRSLFSRCFVEGIGEPNRRPSAGEWKDCLLSEIVAMRHCKVNASHWFGGHLAVCPWCGGGDSDIFPAKRLNRTWEVPGNNMQDLTDGMADTSEVFPVSTALAHPIPGASSSVDISNTSSDIAEGDEISCGSVPDVESEAASATAASPVPAILVPKPHVTVHDVARNITIPCRLPVNVSGDVPLQIHVTADVPWIEVAETVVPVEKEGAVHVTLNTGNMSSKGFQNGRVILRAGDVCEEIFVFVSVQPVF